MARRFSAAVISTVLVALGFTFGITPAAQAAPATPLPVRYVDSTGHSLRGSFLAFYDAHGGGAVFGAPLTEAVVQDGITVQYFEFARFEQHEQVTLASLGRAAAAGREDSAPFAWQAASADAEHQFFAESGHTLGGAFAWFWQSHGGLAVFGYPISEEFDQDGTTTQYFERARFQYDAASGTVLQAPLGRAALEQQPNATAWQARAPVFGKLASASMPIPAVAQHNVALAAQELNNNVVAAGQEQSFLKAVGDISTKAGYTSGLAIVDNQLVQTVGGGVCYDSTVLYRAVWAAGLDVTVKHGHSIMLSAFADQPGMDAAIETSGLDLRWRNDTGNDVYVVTSMHGGALTIELWGTSDGRTVQSGKPVITSRRAPDPAQWTYDSTLAAGTTLQINTSAAGLDIRVSRVVLRADGSVMRREQPQTSYQSSPAIVRFGPGVVPPSDAVVVGLEQPASTSRRE